jgi:hypothetical protein
MGETMTNTMRSVCATAAMALLSAVAAAQAKPPVQVPANVPAAKLADTAAMKHDMPGMQGEPMSGWKELDALHQLIVATWHPASAGDMKPARADAAALLAATQAWRRSKGPAKCDNAALRKGMPDLIADARSFADAAKRDASDDAVKVTLKRTHDGFEALAEPCLTDATKDTKKTDLPKKP